MFTYTKLHMATIECKLAMCISRLVEFELLLKLKFEQKSGTSLHTSRYKAASSLKTVERLSIPVIYFYICAYNLRELPLYMKYRPISLPFTAFNRNTKSFSTLFYRIGHVRVEPHAISKIYHWDEQTQ
jgi:hypothetical protein